MIKVKTEEGLKKERKVGIFLCPGFIPVMVPPSVCELLSLLVSLTRASERTVWYPRRLAYVRSSGCL